MGSQVTRVMGFLPAKFQLPTLFRFRLRIRLIRDRQTDRQTDGHQRLMPIGREHNKKQHMSFVRVAMHKLNKTL